MTTATLVTPRPRPRAIPRGGATRLAGIYEALEVQDLAAIVCARPSNVLLATGYWPVLGTACAVVLRDGWSVLLVTSDEAGAAARSWVDAVRIIPARGSTGVHWLEALTSGLRELGPFSSHDRIGVEVGPAVEPSSYAGTFRYGAGLWNAIRPAWPEVRLVNADALLAELQSHKTWQDRERIARACRVAEHAFIDVQRMVLPGVQERAVAACLASHLSVDASAHARRTGGFAYCMSGPNAAQASRAYAQSTARRLGQNELVLIHCNSYVDGYWTDITRTYYLGEPTDRIRDMYAAVRRARAAALEAIRPGAAARDVDRAARAVLTDCGFGGAIRHSTGHGVGFAAIDADAIPRLSADSDDVLEAGMVCNVEPAIYIDGFGGIRHCDVVAVTAHGAEVLTP